MNYSWELSPFDTEILRYKTAKITHIDHPKNISDLKRNLIKENITYATYRVLANDYVMIQSLEKNDFIFVDGFITLEIHLVNQRNDFPLVQEALPKDYPQIIDLAGSVFRGVTRYYSDPIISTEKADAIYREWVKNSLNGGVADLVLIRKDKKDITGFITLQRKGKIPLIGVSEKARGEGIGKELTLAALAKFQKWGLEKVHVDTQMTNLAALRLYQSLGFKVFETFLTFRWQN